MSEVDLDKKVKVGNQEISMRKLLGITSKLHASDLHIKSGKPPLFRIGSKLLPYKDAVELTRQGHSATEFAIIDKKVAQELIYSMLNEVRIKILKETDELDLSVETEESRFRVNVGYERNGIYATMRVIPHKIREISEIGFPNDTWKDIITLQKGLVLVTGVTGCGKSTTLASLIQEITRKERKKIITVEDPIEYVYQDVASLVIQREVGAHTASFYAGVKYALRQDPDIILIGEIRDYDTAQEALRAAETGHLVFSTLHTKDAVGTIGRYFDLAPTGRQEETASLLANNLEYVLSQQLIPYQREGKRVLAMEIMRSTPAISNNIRENKISHLQDSIVTGSKQGMITMDTCLFNLYKNEKIMEEDAIQYSTNRDSMKSQISKYKQSNRN